jgi:hypothetical protein
MAAVNLALLAACARMRKAPFITGTEMIAFFLHAHKFLG